VKFNDPELEACWQEEAGQRLQRGINWGTVIVGAVLVLSIVRDLVLRWDGWEGLMLFRLCVIAPLIILPWLLSRTQLGARHRADIVLVSLTALFLSMAVMFIWMPALPGASKPLVSLLFLPVFAAATTLFPIGLRRTLVLAITGLFAFLIAYSQVDTSLLRISLMSWTVFALAGVLVGGSWRLERQERLLWLARRRLEVEQESSLSLLQNVFPAPIVDRLLNSEAPIADRYDSLVVLFADVVGFTPMARSMPAARLVERLDGLFKDFDAVVRRHQFTKVKTIGDAYMVVGGLPWEPEEDRASTGARLAWDLMECAHGQHDLKLRIGLHMGPGVAGVIGRERFIYDFWGDTVNVASRLESTGDPGRIQLSADVAQQLGRDDCVQERGVQELKGVGSMKTFWLVAPPVL
jgi:class 3 adenylate cyclase